MTNRQAERQDEALRSRRREDDPDSTPEMAPPATWQVLQRSLGNRAVGRLIEGGIETAQRKATAEQVTPVGDGVQEEIAAQTGTGRPLDESTRAEMEPRLGADLSNVRLHDGPIADRLSRQMRARAFTHGRDIFLGSRARADTLPHELAHVGEDAPGSATVHLQADTETKQEDEDDDLPQVSMSLPGPGEKPRYVDKKKKRIQTLDEFSAGPKGPPLDPKVEAMIEGKPVREEVVEQQFERKMYEEEQLRKGRAALKGQTGGPKLTEESLTGPAKTYTAEEDPGDLPATEFQASALVNYKRGYSDVKVNRPEGGDQGPAQKTPEGPQQPVSVVPETYDIEVTIDNNKKQFKGLTDSQAILELKSEWEWCWSLIEIYKKWHEELRENRYNHRIVGWISDRLGGHGDPPPMDTWNAPANELNRVGRLLQVDLEQMKADIIQKNLEFYQKKMEREGDWGKDGPAMVQEFAAERSRRDVSIAIRVQIGKCARDVQESANKIEAQRAAVFYYKEGTIAGAERGVVIAKEVQKWDKRVASLLPVPGGAAGAALWNAAFTGVTEFAGQAAEVHYGQRDSIDFSTIGKDMLKDGVTAYISGVAAGKLTNRFSSALRARIAARLGVDVAQVSLTKVQQWVIGTAAGVATSPLNAPVRQVMEYHMGQRDEVTIEGLVKETVDNLPETLLMSAAGSAVGTAHGGPEPTGGPKPTAKAPSEPVPAPTEAAPVKPAVAEPVAATTPTVEPVAPTAAHKPVETTTAPATPEAPAAPTATATRAVAPKAAGGPRRRGGTTGKTTRATTEPSAETLAVGDRRTTTRAIDENAKPSVTSEEPSGDELAVGDRRTTTRAVDEGAGNTEEIPVAERRTQEQAVPGEEEPMGEVYGPIEPGVKELPDGTVIQLEVAWDRPSATQVYEKMVNDTRGREAALYHNPETGEYIIVQGNEGTAAVAPGEGPVAGKAQRWKEILDTSDGGRWELQNHSHPNGPGRVVDPVNQVASGAGGDMAVVASESIASGGQPRSSLIDYMTADGPKQTEFGFDPNQERPFWLQLPDGAPRLEFRSIEDYHTYLATNFPGQVGFHPIPEWLSGSNPVQWARQAAYETQSAQRPTQRMNAQAPTQEMPSQRTTQLMNAEAPTQEMPAVDATQHANADAPTQEMPSQRTTQRLNGATGGPPPIPEPASGRPTGRMQAQGAVGEPPPMPAEEGPGGPGRAGPTEPQDVVPIESEIEANQILNTQVQGRRPIRLIPNHDDVVDAWRGEYGQQGGEPPPAWLDESGKLVVDASRVKTIGTLSGPVPPPRPRTEPAGGQTMGTEPPRSRGEDEGYYDEDALPPWEPQQFDPPRVETRIDDAGEAESAYWDQDAANPERPPGMTFDSKTYQANWELAGGKGTAPPGWFDQYGRLNVDANRVNIHEGPVPGGEGPEGGGGPGSGSGPPPQTPGGPGIGMAPKATRNPGGDDEGAGSLGPAGQPEREGGGVVEAEMPESSRTTQKMGKVSAADIVRRRADGMRYIRENDVRFYHATNRAIVRLIEGLQKAGRPWSTDGGGLWITTDPTSPFFSEGQVSVQRTRQIYERYGVPFDDAAAALAQEPVFFEVDLESLPSPSGAGDVMGEFAPGAPGRSGVSTDFQISDLTNSPLPAMRETTSLAPPARGREKASAEDDDVVIIEDEDEGAGSSDQGATPNVTPQVPRPPKLADEPGGGAGPGTQRSWGPPSREVMAEINDPHVAAQLFIEQVRGGNPNARAIRNADMVASTWRYTFRKNTTAPLAWLDGNGNIVIDGTRVDPRIAPGYGRGGVNY